MNKPVEIHLVNLWVIGLNVFLPLVEENGEIGQRSFHWEHLGEAADLYTNLIQHAFYSYEENDKQKIMYFSLYQQEKACQVRGDRIEKRGRLTESEKGQSRTYEVELRFHHSQVCR